MRRTLAAAAALPLLALVLIEAGLRAASFFAEADGGPWRPGAERRVLAVGDSYTYGTNVAPEKTLPVQLQQLLDQEAPGRYSVINYGVAALTSTLLRNRLPTHVSRLRPDTVIVWCGVNDSWNFAETRDVVNRRWLLVGRATRFEIFRRLSVWLHDRRLERDESETEQLANARPRTESDKPFGALESTQTIHWGGVVERIPVYNFSRWRADREIAGRLTDNFAAIAEFAHGAGIGLVFVTYPLEAPVFTQANRAMRAAAERFDFAVVDSSRSVARVPDTAPDKWGPLAHPGPAPNFEIARDLVPLVRAR